VVLCYLKWVQVVVENFLNSFVFWYRLLKIALFSQNVVLGIESGSPQRREFRYINGVGRISIELLLDGDATIRPRTILAGVGDVGIQLQRPKGQSGGLGCLCSK